MLIVDSRYSVFMTHFKALACFKFFIKYLGCGCGKSQVKRKQETLTVLNKLIPG